MKKTPTPLPEILAVLESLSAALTSSDLERSRQLQARMAELIWSRSIDSGDSMIVGTVMATIRRNCPHPSITIDLEVCLSPLRS